MSYKSAERLFLLMPLIQSEDLADSELALQVLEEELGIAELNERKQLMKRLNDL